MLEKSLNAENIVGDAFGKMRIFGLPMVSNCELAERGLYNSNVHALVFTFTLLAFSYHLQNFHPLPTTTSSLIISLLQDILPSA